MFNIGHNVAEGIRSGSIPDSELILQKSSTVKGRVWEIKTLSEETHETHHITNSAASQILAKGQEVHEILKKVANGERLAPEFSEIVKNKQFRLLCRSIPGMETNEHKLKIKNSLEKKAERIKEILALMGKGISQLKQQGKSSKVIGSSYALMEVIFKDKSVPVHVVRKLEEAWKASDTALHF